MAKGATRGQVSGGQNPNYNNYLLGGDQNWLQNFAGQGQQQTQAAQGVGNMAYGMGATYSPLGLQQGNSFGKLADSVQTRAAPTTTYDPRLSQSVGSSQQGGAAQYGLANQLVGMASAPEGPSAAQAQLAQGRDAAINASMSAARSGSGFGESANALTAAGAQASQATANAANSAAALRAQEAQQHVQNQQNALGLAGNQLSNARAGDAGLAQQLAQQGQFNTQTELQQRQANDAFSQNAYGNQLASQQLGLQGANASLQTQLGAIGAQQATSNQQLAAAQAQQQGTMGYENDLNNLYATDMQHNIQARQLDMQRAKDRTNGISSAIGSFVGGLAMMSDRRAKKNVTDRSEELARVYRALGGDAA